jgi:hypothetical protein
MIVDFEIAVSPLWEYILVRAYEDDDEDFSEMADFLTKIEKPIYQDDDHFYFRYSEPIAHLIRAWAKERSLQARYTRKPYPRLEEDVWRETNDIWLTSDE